MLVDQLIGEINVRRKKKLINRIHLMESFIKIFIKHFILNFKLAFEDKDEIIKQSKVNIEFVLRRVINKYKDIFKYKSINLSFNFDGVNDKYNLTEYYYFKAMIKAIFVFLFNAVQTGFKLEIECVLFSKSLRMNFKKKAVRGMLNEYEQGGGMGCVVSDLEKEHMNAKDVTDSIQTQEMVKGIIMKLSHILGVKVIIFPKDSYELIQLNLKFIREELKDDVDINEFELSGNYSETVHHIPYIPITTRTGDTEISLEKILKKTIRKDSFFGVDLAIDELEDDVRERRTIKNLRNKISLTVSGLRFKSGNKFSKIKEHSDSSSDKNKEKKTISSGKTFMKEDDWIISPNITHKISKTNSLGNSKRSVLNRSPNSSAKNLASRSTPHMDEKIANSHRVRPFRPKIPTKRKSKFATNGSLLIKDDRHSSNDNKSNAIIIEHNQFSCDNSSSNSTININNLDLAHQKHDIMSTTRSMAIVKDVHTDCSVIDVKEELAWRSAEEPTKKRYECLCNCNDVLIVDDEMFNLSSMKFLIEKKNKIKVDTARNGLQCLHMIKKRIELDCQSCRRPYYSLILMDIMMPIMDGLEASRQIQEMIDNNILDPNTKIFVVSAQKIPDIEDIIKKCKVINEFISKPVKKGKIVELLEKHHLI